MHHYLRMVRPQKSNTKLNSAAISQNQSVGKTNWITIVILVSVKRLTLIHLFVEPTILFMTNIFSWRVVQIVLTRTSLFIFGKSKPKILRGMR